MKRRGNIIIILAIVISIAIGAVIYFGLKSNNPPPKPTENITISGSNLTNYTSKDLKISFKYPQNWYVNEKNFSILITSYTTFIGEGKSPKKNEIKIDIDRASLCQSDIEKNLIFGGCGENQKILNQILNKEVKTNSYGITISKFVVKFPDNSQKTLYYLEKEDRIIQLTKQPDPSQFEKEFEEIVNSIKFLP